MLSYRNLLKKTWNISLKNKYLWVFGLFASLAATSGSIEYQILSKNLSRNLVDGSYLQLNNILSLGDLMQGLGAGLSILFIQDPWIILNALTLIIVSITLIVSFVWLAISSQVALVDHVKKILGPKKKTHILSIQEGLTIGNKKFWPVLGLNVLIKIAVSLVFFIISIPLLFMLLSNTTGLIVTYLILFVFLVPVAVSLALMIKYAIAYNVLENESFLASLEKGWKLFIKNWLVSLEMAVMLFIINFLFGIAALIVISVLFFPLFLIGAMFNMIWLSILMLLFGILVVILLGSFLTTFQTATWTTLFVELNKKKGTAKLERLFQRK